MFTHAVAVYQIVSPICDDAQRLERPSRWDMEHGTEIALNGFNIMERHSGNKVPRRSTEQGKLHLTGSMFFWIFYSFELQVILIPEAFERPVMLQQGPRTVYQVRLHDRHSMNERHPVH